MTGIARSTPSPNSSPNFGPRRDGLRPRLIILHYTAMESCAAARARLCDPVAEVSAHWLISEQGAAEALVSEAARAWHAGRSYWQGLEDVNSASIGIELANRGDHPFPEPQMAALEVLLRQIMARWDIPAAGVLAHSDIAPDRKIDPGPRFDWRRLERQGLALAARFSPAEAPAAAADELAAGFLQLAARIGYDPKAAPEALLRALRLRHRPWAQGPLAEADLRLMQGLGQISR